MNDVRQKLGLPSGRNGRTEVTRYEIRRDPKQQEQRRRKEGHDDLISRLRMHSQITVTFLSGEIRTGLLQESDRFTITIRIPREGCKMSSAADDPERIELVYKHAIESFYLTKLNIDE